MPFDELPRVYNPERGFVCTAEDMDGGYGVEQCPNDMDTIADLARLEPILKSRGYSAADINDIFHNNWLRFFRRVLPN